MEEWREAVGPFRVADMQDEDATALYDGSGALATDPDECDANCAFAAQADAVLGDSDPATPTCA